MTLELTIVACLIAGGHCHPIVYEGDPISTYEECVKVGQEVAQDYTAIHSKERLLHIICTDNGPPKPDGKSL
jgi:hypothetical protein